MLLLFNSNISQSASRKNPVGHVKTPFPYSLKVNTVGTLKSQVILTRQENDLSNVTEICKHEEELSALKKDQEVDDL